MVCGAPDYAAWVLGSMSSGVVGIDARGAIALINEGARRILGVQDFSADEALGRDCRDVLRGQPNVSRLLLDALAGRDVLSRAELEATVVRENADIGFAFDGDGDRFFIVDDRGQFVPGDFVTALLATYMLERYRGAKIVYDVRCSWAVRDTVTAAGGTALIERVGHSFLKPRMFEEGAVFAGELSGHYYFTDFFGADSGVVPSLLVLEMLSRKGKRFWSKTESVLPAGR